MATSTIIVEKVQNFDLLKARYRLIRYIVPESFRYREPKPYDQLYVSLRSQVSVPYLVFLHDELDRTKKVVIYALYPKEGRIADITLPFLSDDRLPFSEIDFGRIRLFNLIKLLQAEFFNVWPRFASMGKYYIHAKQEKDWHTCLEIIVKGANKNIDAQQRELPHQEFWVTGEATNFIPVTLPPDDFSRRHRAYFRRHMKDGFVVFEQLPADQIEDNTDGLFRIYSSKSNPAHLEYHNQDSKELKPSRGSILFQFTTKFVERLQELGIAATRKTRNWLHYSPQKNVRMLPGQLSAIYLYDCRINRTSHPITVYQSLLADRYPEFQFVTIQNLADANHQPVLVLQDSAKQDFEEGGILLGEEDPYKLIYREYPDIPKQSINVNGNSKTLFSGSRSSYLEYPLISLANNDEEGNSDSTWEIQFQVCFFQLYLKDVILNRKSVLKSLTFNEILRPLMDYVYVRKQSYRGTPYHVMMRFENDQLSFHDLGDPDQKALLSEITESWGYDWLDVEDNLMKKRYKEKSKGEDVAAYDLILTAELAIELETMEETILYKYDEIARRLNMRQEKKPVESFKLVPHYDKLKPRQAIAYDDLKGLGLLNGRIPDGERESISVAFWRQLLEYDALLDEIRIAQARISYDEIMQIRRAEIGAIFGLPCTRSGIYNTSRLLDYYKKTIWDIPGFKSEDVQLSKGIWFDPSDMAYMVGDVNGFKGAQDKQNRIRRFDILHGNKARFDIKPFLEATGAQFIRYRQYTVYPFPFYLIDKYVQDVLFHRAQ